jgi:capsular exopolysaccharide synthesis family protein
VHPGQRSANGLRWYVRVIRRRKLIILTSIGLVTVSAFGASAVRQKVYESSAEVLLQSRLAESIFARINEQTSLGTEIQVLKSAPVAQLVRKKIGAAPAVTVVPITQTELFEIRARSTSPERAAAVANAYGEAYIEYRRKQAVDDLLQAGQQIEKQIIELQLQIDDLTEQIAAAGPRQLATAGPKQFATASLIPRRDSLLTQQGLLRQKLDELQADASNRAGGAQLVNPATAPTTPASPQPKRDGLMGMLAGSLLGLAFAFIVENIDDTIKMKEELEEVAHGLPVVGLIPKVVSWRRRSDALVISRTDPTSPAAEAYRTLRTSIGFVSLDRAMRTLQITSPGAADGKSTTIANLAVALARAGQKVIVVDCDLRRPRIHEFFGLSNDVGFTNVLLGEQSLSASLQAVPGEDNLTLLASGSLPPNPSELLTSQRTVEVFVALQVLADIVLLDCSPVLPVTDAAVLSARVDATLLVATAGSTTKREMTQAVELLRQVEAPLFGSVLNSAKFEEHYGGYGYGYYYRLDDERPSRGRGDTQQPVASG